MFKRLIIFPIKTPYRLRIAVNIAVRSRFHQIFIPSFPVLISFGVTRNRKNSIK